MYTTIQGSIKPIIHTISIVSLDIYEKKKSPVKKNENMKDANIQVIEITSDNIQAAPKRGNSSFFKQTK